MRRKKYNPTGPLFIVDEENNTVQFNEICEGCNCSDKCKQGYKVELFSCKKFEPNEESFVTIRQFVEQKSVTKQLVTRRMTSTLKDYVVEINGEKFLKADALKIPRDQLRSTDSQTEE